jgi:Chromo (CHRromatin Organisation MOdifier) domain
MGFMPKLWSTKTASTLPEVERWKEWLQVSRDHAQEAIKKAQSMVMKCNKQQKGHKAYKPYEEGDLVWLDGKNLHMSHPVAKLAPKHWGPFKVINVINPVSFHLEIPPQWKQKKVHPMFHTSLLSPYKEMEEHGANFPEPPPDLVEGEEEYEVEEILGSRQHGHGKKLQYLLKWKGYSYAHNSWESAYQVHAPNLIAKFHWENPKSMWVLEINSCEEDSKSTMPYSSPYNNASSNLGTTIIASFFEDAPRVPCNVPQLETPIICRHCFEGPQFSNPWDRGEASKSEEDSSSDAAGEIYSISPMTPLSARLSQPSHLTSKLPPLPTVINLMDKEITVKKELSLEQMSIRTLQLQLKLWG